MSKATAVAGRPEKLTIMNTLSYIYRENGIKGLYRGVTPRIGLGIWQTVCMVSFADYVKAWFVAPSSILRTCSLTDVIQGSKQVDDCRDIYDDFWTYGSMALDSFFCGPDLLDLFLPTYHSLYLTALAIYITLSFGPRLLAVALGCSRAWTDRAAESGAAVPGRSAQADHQTNTTTALIYI